MKLLFDTPMRIVEARATEIQDRPYLFLRVEGPTGLGIGKSTGEITFYYEGFKHRTTLGKGAIQIEHIHSLDMIDCDGRFELRARIGSTDQNCDNVIVHRIAAADSVETTELILRTLSRIGFVVQRDTA